MRVEDVDGPKNPLPMMELHHVMGFKLQGGDVITPGDLIEDTVELRGLNPFQVRTHLSASDHDMLSDEFLLRNMVLRTLAVAVYGEEENPAVLGVEVEKFTRESQPTLNGGEKPERILYAVRFIPASGTLTGVSYREPRLSSWGLQTVESTPDRVSLNVYDWFSATFYYESQFPDDLPPLISPDNF